MKQYPAFILLTFFCNALLAQEKHFVYIESENRQPFYVSVNGQSYSSTASGYIIIPKLAAGDYTATIGFAGNTVAPKTFRYTIDQKDLGFDLKNLGERGWVLFNQQTLTLLPGIQATAEGLVKTIESKPSDEEQEPEISFERKKDIPGTPLEKAEQQATGGLATPATTAKDTTIPSSVPGILSAETSSPLSPVITEPTQQKAEARPNRLRLANSKVKKVAEVKGDMGVYLTFEDSNAEASDTVQLIIPIDGDKVTPQRQTVSTKGSTPATTKRPAKKTRAESGNPQFLDMAVSNSIKADSTINAKGDNITNTTELYSSSNVPAPAVNSACTNMASESDYSKLRKRMASQTTEEAKLKEARKVFKNKCFTTGQIKGLSSLFLSDAERYRFFDVSYNVVTDVQLYSSLEKELVDPYYVNRFKAMLRK